MKASLFFSSRPSFPLRCLLSLLTPIAIAIGLSSAVAAADDMAWTSVGPYGSRGVVWAAAIDPTSGTIYVAGQQGISKSADGGANWVVSSAGLTSSAVRSLVVDPRTPSTVYAGTDSGPVGGVFKSIDAGRSWSRLGNSPPATTVLAIDRQAASTLYAGTERTGVFKTTDGGATWNRMSEGLAIQGVMTLAVDPRTSGTVYAGGRLEPGSPSGLARTTDGGTHWVSVVASPTPAPVLSLAMDPKNPSTIYLSQQASTGINVLRTTDGGDSWLSITEGLPFFAQPLALAVDPRSPLTVYATGTGVFKSVNGGLFWTSASAGLSPSFVRVLVIDPLSPDVLYAGTDRDGLFKTNDAGATWSRLTGLFANLNVTALAADPLAPLTIYAGTSPSGDPSGGGIFRTRDGGSSWIELETKISNAPVNTLRIDPSDPSVVYATTSAEAGVLKSTNGGESWAPANAGLPTTGAGSFALDPTSPSTAYVSTNSGVYRSRDGAATWSPTALSSGAVLAVAPTSPPTIYAGGLGLARSFDGGGTWTTVNTGLTGFIASIAVDPFIPTTVYVGARGFVCLPGPFPCRVTINGIARSTDGGASWRLVNDGLARTDVSEIAIDPRDSGKVFAAVGGSVYGSTNAGGRWQSLADRSLGEFGGRSAGTLVVDFSAASNLYAGVFGASVFKRNASIAAVPCAPDPTTLCLNAGRFQVQAIWSAGGGGGLGQAIPLTSDTGAFWFFTANNLELVTKVVDGRSFNGRFWVFVGALSDVEYIVRVTDMVTGDGKTYFHPQGAVASIGDTSAF